MLRLSPVAEKVGAVGLCSVAAGLVSAFVTVAGLGATVVALAPELPVPDGLAGDVVVSAR